MQTIALENRIGRTALDLGIALLGSIFFAFMSQIAIPLPFTPIPFTLQTLGVFLLGGLLGSKRGSLSILLFLLQGTVGLPVFAGGISNPLWFLTMRGGYLIGFAVTAFLVGKMVEMRPRGGFFYLLSTLTLGNIAILGIGMVWIAAFVGLNQAFLIGVLPFLSNTVIQIVAGAGMLKVRGLQGVFRRD